MNMFNKLFKNGKNNEDNSNINNCNENFFDYYKKYTTKSIGNNYIAIDSDDNDKNKNKTFYVYFKNFIMKNKLSELFMIVNKISILNNYLKSPQYAKKVYEWLFSFRSNGSEFTYDNSSKLKNKMHYLATRGLYKDSSFSYFNIFKLKNKYFNAYTINTLFMIFGIYIFYKLAKFMYGSPIARENKEIRKTIKELQNSHTELKTQLKELKELKEEIKKANGGGINDGTNKSNSKD